MSAEAVHPCRNPRRLAPRAPIAHSCVAARGTPRGAALVLRATASDRLRQRAGCPVSSCACGPGGSISCGGCQGNQPMANHAPPQHAETSRDRTAVARPSCAGRAPEGVTPPPSPLRLSTFDDGAHLCTRRNQPCAALRVLRAVDASYASRARAPQRSRASLSRVAACGRLLRLRSTFRRTADARSQRARVACGLGTTHLRQRWEYSATRWLTVMTTLTLTAAALALLPTCACARPSPSPLVRLGRRSHSTAAVPGAAARRLQPEAWRSRGGLCTARSTRLLCWCDLLSAAADYPS